MNYVLSDVILLQALCFCSCWNGKCEHIVFDGLTLKQVTQVCCASEHSFTSHRIVINWTYSPLKQIPLSLWSEHYYNSVSEDLEKSTSKISVEDILFKLSFKTKTKCVWIILIMAVLMDSDIYTNTKSLNSMWVYDVFWTYFSPGSFFEIQKL